MSSNKEEFEVIVTPAGVAAYCHLSEPDTKGEYANDKYKLTLVMEPEKSSAWMLGSKKMETGTQGFKKFIDSRHAKAPAVKGELNESPLKVGKKDEAGNEKEEFLGKYLMVFQSKFQPKFIGVDGAVTEEAPRAGDVVRVMATLSNYDNRKIGAGLTARLSKVRIVEKRAAAPEGSGGDFPDLDDSPKAKAQVKPHQIDLDDILDDDVDF